MYYTSAGAVTQLKLKAEPKTRYGARFWELLTPSSDDDNDDDDICSLLYVKESSDFNMIYIQGTLDVFIKS